MGNKSRDSMVTLEAISKFDFVTWEGFEEPSP